MDRRWVTGLVVTLILGACGRGEAEIDSGPIQPDDDTTTSTSTTTPREASDDDQVETEDSTSSSTSPPSSATDQDPGTATTVVIDLTSDNAQAYTELAASGLVLTLDEQECADSAVESEIADGEARIDAVISAVTTCASPKAVDDFASGLISAGGASLPPTEAACVASRLRSDDGYRPFWSALFAEEPFDFLISDLDVQNLYLGLFSECVSVGRALSGQLGNGLSAATMGCIDSLYSDREFVRVTIEADLSGDPDELDRINSQIATCLSTSERSALGLS